MNISRKWPIFILSLLFSFVVWVWINLQGEFQTFMKVKVETVNLP